MKDLIKAEELKKKLDALRPISQEIESKILQKFRLDWNSHSNNLEGNSLTYSETKMFLLNGTTASNKPFKDHLQIKGHNEAINLVYEVAKSDREITENFIRELHFLILKEPYEVDAITPDGKATKKIISIGEYKTLQNHVKTKTNEIFYFAEPFETPAKMHDLIKWLTQEIKKDDINPIILAAEFHYKFIRIHPFDDGNGRIARILMNLILMKFGFPPVIIKTQDKENYFLSLRKADAGFIEDFIDYIAKNLLYSLELMIKAANGEEIEEDDDLDKKIALLKTELKNHSLKENFTSKTKEIVLELCNNNLKNLFDKFFTSCEKFDDFYHSKKIFIYINNIYSIKKVSNKNELFDIINSTNEIIEKIEIYYDHIDLKLNKTSSKIDSSTRLSVDFYHNTYSIYLKFQYDSDDLQRIFKNYNETLSDEEIKEIIKTHSEKHYKEIESKITKTSKT